MKLHKLLTVGGQPYSIASDDSRLELFTPGRATYTVNHNEVLSGVVVFSCGFDKDQLKPWFIGFIETCTKVNEKQRRIFCREMAAMLQPRLPMALRDVTLADVLLQISELTKLHFSLPSDPQGYTNRRAARFYNIAGGYFALDALADVFSIDKPVWQQQADGKIFVGSWDHSRWASRPVELPNQFESQVTIANGATLPALPALRPGANYNGSIVTAVAFSDSKMQLSWDVNPWKDR